MGYYGDDFTFETQGWDDIVVEDIESTDGCCLVTGPDGYLGNSGCPTWFWVHKKLVQAMDMGEFVNSSFPLEGTDKCWGDICNPLDLVLWEDRLHMEHHHATRGIRDDTFNRLQQSASDFPGYGASYWAYVKKAQANIMKNLKP